MRDSVDTCLSVQRVFERFPYFELRPKIRWGTQLPISGTRQLVFVFGSEPKINSKSMRSCVLRHLTYLGGKPPKNSNSYYCVTMRT